MERNASQQGGQGGFTLVEVLVSLVVLSMVMVAATAISLSGVVRISDDSRERQDDATTAQWLSVAFARDVQGASAVVAECSPPGSGSRLVTLKASDSDHVVEYRVVPSSGTFGIYRAECWPGGTTRKVVGGLDSSPSALCDGSPCVDGSTPRVVSLDVARTPTFEFELDGARRTTDGNSTSPPSEPPTFMALGGDTPLSVGGGSQLEVVGNALINKPTTSNVAVNINGSGAGPGEFRLNISGEFRLQDGSVCNGCTGAGKANKPPGTFATAIPDPLRFLAAPDEINPPVRTDCPPHAGVRVCQPGIYNLAFPVAGGGGGSVKDFELEPGIYVLKAGIKANSNGSIKSRGGVMFYNSSGGVNINGGVDLDLTPPANGPYAGILYFQARTNTSTFTINGGGTLNSLVGTIYAPKSDGVVLGGGGGELHVGRVIGSSLSTSGNGRVIVDGS